MTTTLVEAFNAKDVTAVLEYRDSSQEMPGGDVYRSTYARVRYGDGRTEWTPIWALEIQTV